MKKNGNGSTKKEGERDDPYYISPKMKEHRRLVNAANGNTANRRVIRPPTLN